VNRRNLIVALSLAVPLVGTFSAGAAEIKAGKETVSFGALRTMDADAARAQALSWLKSVGKTDEASQKAFEALWSQNERPVLDRLADAFSLGDAAAAKLLATARNPASAAPQDVPAFIKDAKLSAFYRSNLGLAYAKSLSQRRVYEEALEALKLVKPENVADPATYLFHRAVAEHALGQRDEAVRSIVRLLDDTSDAPERYRMVAVLMAFDMQSWREKDLGDIARKMDNIERRLELARGGPKTQKIQKEVISRLDELIKQMENECNGQCNCNGGSCPNGGKPGAGNKPSSPQRDSYGGNNSGSGNVDPKQIEALARQWGKLPEKERAKAMQELSRDMPPKYRDIIESYFRKLAANDSSSP
jgi:tetratricopeptide (TPR) repeat protein